MVSSTELVTKEGGRQKKWSANILEDGDAMSAILDSGAQISIVPFAVVDFFQLKLKRLSQPVAIIFGNGSRTICNTIVYFGVLVGDVFAVEDAVDCFINLGTFIDNGDRAIVFSTDKVQVVDSEGGLVIKGPRDKATGYWKMDLEEILNYKPYSGGRWMETAVSAQQSTVGSASTSPSRRGQCNPELQRLPRTSRRGQPIPERVQQLARELHRLWRHPHPVRMASVVTHSPGSIPARFKELDAATILKVFDHNPCQACAVAKFNKLPAQVGSGASFALGVAWAVDWVPVKPTTMYGANGVYQFVELATNMTEAVLARKDDAAMMVEALEMLLALSSTYSHTIRLIRFDAGSVPNSALFVRALANHHIRAEPAASGEQRQNPAERTIQTMKKLVAATFVDQRTLPRCYWGHNWLTTNMVMRMMPNTKCPFSSPWEEYTGLTPDLSKIKYPFGTPEVAERLVRTVAVGTAGEEEMCMENSLDPNGEFVIAIGAPDTADATTLVVVPGRGMRPTRRSSTMASSKPLSQSKMRKGPVFFPRWATPSSTSRWWLLSRQRAQRRWREHCGRDPAVACQPSTPSRTARTQLSHHHPQQTLGGCGAERPMRPAWGQQEWPMSRNLAAGTTRTTPTST